MKIKNVFTNTYGLARTCLALSMLISLLFTNPYLLFDELFFKPGLSGATGIPNFFYIFGESNLYFAVTSAVVILLWIISGYLPQLTGILHAWIAYSFFTGSAHVEGGDQIAQIITILLIPITVFDKRINHWSNNDYFKYKRPKAIAYFCYSAIVIVQLQMAILYLFAGADKLAVPEWIDGSAFYYYFNSHPFGATNVVKTIFNPVISNHFLSPLVNWGILTLELILFAALFMNRKKKRTLFYIAIAFHFMIILIHGLISFFLAMAGGLILYLLPVNGLNLQQIINKPRIFFNRLLKAKRKNSL